MAPDWQCSSYQSLYLGGLIFCRCLAVFIVFPTIRKIIGWPASLALALAAFFCCLSSLELKDFEVSKFLLLALEAEPELKQSFSKDFFSICLEGMFLLKVFTNLILGALIAFPLYIVFEFFRSSARLFDTARGARFSEHVSVNLGENTSYLEQYSSYLALALIFLANGHLRLLEILEQSFRVIEPSAGFALSSSTGTSIREKLGELVIDITIFAGPALLVIFLFDIGNAIISRLVPGVPIFFETIAFKQVLGLLLLFISGSILLESSYFSSGIFENVFSGESRYFQELVTPRG